MSARTLAIALGVLLAVSMGVNLFAATAAFTALGGQNRLERRIEGQTRQARPSTRDIVAALDPATRRTVRQALRQASTGARPDFQKARDLRQQAIVAARAEAYDPARVTALLDQSRKAEIAGRTKMEADAVAILATLAPDDRRALAEVLNGRGRGRNERPAASTPPSQP